MKPAATAGLVLGGLVLLGVGVKLVTNQKVAPSNGGTLASPKDHRERPDPFAPARPPVPDPAQVQPPAPAPEPQPAPPRTPAEVLARISQGKQVVLTGKCQCKGELVLTADVLRFNCQRDRDRDILFGRSDVERVDKNGLRIIPPGSMNKKPKTYHFKLEGMSNEDVHTIFTGWLRATSSR